MTDENFLSQEDIDALMKGMDSSGDDSSSGNSSSGNMNMVDGNSLNAPTELILNQGSTVVSTVLNKNVDFSLNSIEALSEEILSGQNGQFKEDSLYINVQFSAGVKGHVYLIITKALTAKIADLMMMGDGSAPYEEDHKDAITELTNQMMGAVSTAMGNETGTSITNGSATCEILEQAEFPVSLGTGFAAKCSITIEGFPSEEILIIYSQEMVNSLISIYGGSKGSSSSSSIDSGKSSDYSKKSGIQLDDELVVEESTSSGNSSLYSGTGNPNIDMLFDIPLDVNIELGRAQMSIRKILELGPGAIVEIDRKASEPVDLMINDKIIARGEVVVVDEYFGIRIVSLLSPEDRIKQLR